MKINIDGINIAIAELEAAKIDSANLDTLKTAYDTAKAAFGAAQAAFDAKFPNLASKPVGTRKPMSDETKAKMSEKRKAWHAENKANKEKLAALETKGKPTQKPKTVPATPALVTA